MPKTNREEALRNTGEVKHKDMPVYHFKVLDEGAGIIEAIVAVFGNVDFAGERIIPGATTDSIGKKLPRVAWAHDWSKPIGKTLEARELPPGDPMLPESIRQNGGLYVKGQLNLGTQRGREAFSDLTFGSVEEFSIGYKTLESQTTKDGIDELTKLLILEWSPVLIGCNQETALISAKDMNTPHAKDFDPSQLTHFKNIPGVSQKGEYLGENVEGNLVYYLICDLGNMFSWACWRIVNGEGSSQEKIDALAGAMDEMKAIIIKVAPALLEENVAEEAIEKALTGVSFKSVHSFFGLHVDVKEGKKFSKKSVKMLTEHCDALDTGAKAIRKMMEEDEEETDSAEGKSLSTTEITTDGTLEVKTTPEPNTATQAEPTPTPNTAATPESEAKSVASDAVRDEVARLMQSEIEIDRISSAVQDEAR